MKQITRIDQTDNNDVSREGNSVRKYCIANSRLDELSGRMFLRVAVQLCMPIYGRQCPELAVMMFQNI